MDQNLLSGVLRMAGAFLPPPPSSSIPYDLLESDDLIKVYIEIPGVNPSALSIDFFNNKLKISGPKVPYEIEDGYELKKCSITGENIDISIQLPLAITNRKNVKVKLDRGILSIVIDKNEESKNKFSMKIEE